MREEIQSLLDSDIHTRELARITKVNVASISLLRSGKKPIGKLSIETGEKLKNYWEELKMKNTLIRWTGKSTDGVNKWSAEGLGYKDLFETLIQKYGDDIVTYDMLDAKKLEINGEDLEKYGVTTDGIGNWELFEEFEQRKDLKELSEKDYKEVILEAKGNAYYQNFEEESTIYFSEEGDIKEEIKGFHSDIVETVVVILNNFATDYQEDYNDLIHDIEQSDNTEEVIAILESDFNNSTYAFKTDK